MDIADIKEIVRNVVKEDDSATSVHYLLIRFRLLKEIAPERLSEMADKIWDYLREQKYVPQELNNEDDTELIQILFIKGHEIHDINPLKYACLILFHRFILGDLMEKALMARLLIQLCIVYRDEMTALCREFIEACLDKSFYGTFWDESDRDPLKLMLEFIRAVIPYAKWYETEYPDSEIEAVPNDIWDFLKKNAAACDSALSPALPKFTSFSRYLYASIGETENKD